MKLCVCLWYQGLEEVDCMVRALSGVLAAACGACGLARGSGWTMAQGARGRTLGSARPGLGRGRPRGMVW